MGSIPSDQTSAGVKPAEAIAVIGFSFRFPENATSSDGLWRLMMEKRCVSRSFPEDRINLHGIYHPDATRHDTIATQGAHFFSEDPTTFDAPFFAISATEAETMDPQQRHLLEVTYHALENAGIRMQDIAGSNTSVFTGCFTDDYKTLYQKDIDDGAPYAATGIMTTLNANRVSWFFNTLGTSVNVDTACSSSLVALDLACQNLRSGDSDLSMVSGSNLILTPDLFVALSDMNMISKDSRCWSFDERANGYARGEGVAVLILKRMVDAVRDGDTIRAVIVSTGSNHDGHTPGITQPSQKAQEMLIRQCYSKNGLDTRRTAFFEAHGTGTPVGDPIEANAIGNVFREGRDADDPIYVGALKANIGHLEGASGIAGVVKTILALEKAIIPPNTSLDIVNHRIDEQELRIRFPRSALPWPKPGLRRASVNSFGFGGSNAHVVIDDAYHYMLEHGLRGNHNTAHQAPLLDTLRNSPDIWLGSAPRRLLEGLGPAHQDATPKLLVFSSGDEAGIGRIAETLNSHYQQMQFTNVLEREAYLSDLAFTLGTRRSQLAWRSFAVCKSREPLNLENEALSKPLRPNGVPTLAFIFTGQGAQWAEMGKDLLAYAVFRRSLEDADSFLRSLGCQWSLLECLLQPAESSQIDHPMFSQPICTALQVALIELLETFGISPSAVIGHSSGEIAAAYCAGAISRESAWKIAYMRGLYTSKLIGRDGPCGSMMSVGLSVQRARELIDLSGTHRVVVACQNSPRNVTLSGDSDQIDDLALLLQKDNVFHRKLKISTAYHSPHMKRISKEYADSIGSLDGGHSLDAHPTIISTVSGRRISAPELRNPSYWADNLVSPVKFDEAIEKICAQNIRKKLDRSHLGKLQIDICLEIGPHPALAGSIRDVARLKDKRMAVLGTLRRGSSASMSLIETAGHLHCLGYPVDIEHINHGGKPRRELMALCDLPGYPFDHSKSYFHESLISKGTRFRSSPRLDLLGKTVPDWNPLEARWRHFLRLSELPWMEDHMVNGSILYPAAGMIVMGLEAMAQLASTTQEAVAGFHLRNVRLRTALVIPNTSRGVEVRFSLRRPSNIKGKDVGWSSFCLYANTDGTWIEICTGLIRVDPGTISSNLHDKREEQLRRRQSFFEQLEQCNQVADGEKLYDGLRNMGLEFGPTFRTLTSPRFNHKSSSAVINIFQWSKSAGTNPGQPHVVHPCTLDALLQLPIVSFTQGGMKECRTMVPSFIRRMWISRSGLGWPRNDQATAVSQLTSCNNQGLEASTTALTQGDRNQDICARLEGVQYTFVGGSSSQNNEAAQKHAFWNLAWKPDLNQLSFKQVSDFCKATPAQEGEPSVFYEKLTFLLFAFLFRLQKDIESNPLPEIPNHLHHYLDWAREQTLKYQDNMMVGSHLSWKYRALDEDLLSSLCSQIENENAQGKVAVAVGQRLTRLVRGEIDVLEFLFHSNLLSDLYQEVTDKPNAFKSLHKYLDLYSHKNPQARYLEVGAGTGGSTGNILNALGSNMNQIPALAPARYSAYAFTDISESFFEKARAKFQGCQNIEYKRLDIEAAPSEQGFEEEVYDVVIASNVIHATSSLSRTLNHVRRLLRPGGQLIMYEITNPEALRNNFVMGLLPGWWRSTEDFRTKGPCLSSAKWHDLLRASGFTGVDHEFRDYESDICHEASVLVATKTDGMPVSKSTQMTSSVIISEQRTPLQIELVSQLQKYLEPDQVHVLNLANAAESSLCSGAHATFFTDDLFGPVLEDLDETRFVQLQKLFSKSQSVVWLTAATTDGRSTPGFGLVDGLARVLRVEMSLKFVTIALDPESLSFASWAPAISEIGKTTIDAPADSYESAFEEKDGVLQVCRLQVSEQVSEDVHVRTLSKVSEHLAWASCPPMRLTTGSPGMLDSLSFVEDHDVRNPLANDEVEIEVRAVGLSSRDCLIALGSVGENTFGNECSGIVTRCGSLSRFKPGDRVCMNTMEAFKTFARSKMELVYPLPPKMSFAQAAALPTDFITAWTCIHEITRLRPGESILIHAGAGGTGQALIQLSKLIGADIFVTVKSMEEKRLVVNVYGLDEDHILDSQDLRLPDHLHRKTSGRGVDVNINSLVGEGLFASWDCVAPYGRFVHIGEKGLSADENLPMFKFNDDVTFTSFDRYKWIRDRPEVGRRAMENIMKMFARGDLQTVHPIHSYSISEVSEAFRQVHDGIASGKTVLEVTPEAIVPTVLNRNEGYTFEADKTYVIAGGLGGIGRTAARWLVNRGARWLLLLSRSGVKTASARHFIQELEGSGAHIAAPSCDISDRQALESILPQASRDMPPIAGCVQATMVLKDTSFENMSFAEWDAVLRPKVAGSWNLHELLPRGLDFFILLSSVSGVLGPHGQANYAAANTYLDALAHHRVARGEKAVSVDLGAVISDGYLAENQRIRDRLLAHGSMLPITREQIHGILDYYCDPSHQTATSLTCQAVVGINTPANMVAQGLDEPSWMRQPFFSAMHRSSNSKDAQTMIEDDIRTVRRNFAAASSRAQAAAIVADALVSKLRRTLSTVPDDVDTRTQILTYGADSLLAVELRNWLSKHFDADVPVFEILGGTSFASLGATVAGKSWKGHDGVDD